MTPDSIVRGRQASFVAVVALWTALVAIGVVVAVMAALAT